ncbi:MAG: hypothetical protein J5798_10280 [Spirochaetaceae bacterium]|nr:hypothetical protein [Spirochaetaceae bacterium]
MTNLEFFKNEAKKFLKDWRTQTQTVGSDGAISYHYDWMFYDVGDLFFYYELDDKDEQNIKLARAQHYIANMLGYKKWDNLIHASDTELELAEFLLRHFKNAQDVQGWQETLMFTGIEQYGEEAVLEYAKQYYMLKDTKENIQLPRPTILFGQTKIAGLQRGIEAFGMFKMDTKVRCFHCGREYLYKEASVVQFPYDDEPSVFCKHYPECNGSLIDMDIVDEVKDTIEI